MDLGLVGRRAFGTGGSRGIGIGIVKTLAGEGACVTFCGSNVDDGARVERDMTSAGLKVRFIAGDVRRTRALTRSRHVWPRLDRSKFS
jgi:3-oxoacyl-[acyl-carrier protein] reductase